MENEPENEPVGPYTPKSDEELKQLALDIRSGNVFLSSSISPAEGPRILSYIFIPLAWAGEDFKVWCLKNKICLFYEYMSVAGPRSINGYPTFFSVRSMSEADLKRLTDYMEKIEKALSEI